MNFMYVPEHTSQRYKRNLGILVSNVFEGAPHGRGAGYQPVRDPAAGGWADSGSGVPKACHAAPMGSYPAPTEGAPLAFLRWRPPPRCLVGSRSPPGSHLLAASLVPHTPSSSLPWLASGSFVRHWPGPARREEFTFCVTTYRDRSGARRPDEYCDNSPLKNLLCLVSDSRNGGPR